MNRLTLSDERHPTTPLSSVSLRSGLSVRAHPPSTLRTNNGDFTSSPRAAAFFAPNAPSSTPQAPSMTTSVRHNGISLFGQRLSTAASHNSTCHCSAHDNASVVGSSCSDASHATITPFTTECVVPPNDSLLENLLLAESVIKAIQTTLEPDGHSRWLIKFQSFIRRVSPSAARIIDMSEDQWAECCHSPYADDWATVDSLLASTLTATIKPGTEGSELLEERMITTRQWDSGYAILSTIESILFPTGGPQLRRREREIETRKYFEGKLTPNVVMLQCSRIQRDWSRLPEGKLNDPIKFLKHAFSKLPQSKLNVAKSEAWLNKAYEAEACGRDLPWSWADLSSMISVLLCPDTPAEANATDRVTTPAPGQRCVVCGQHDHIATNCTRKCQGCGMKGCPGTMGGKGKCAVLLGKIPNDWKGPTGQKPPAKILRFLQARIDKEKGVRPTPRTANDAEAEAEGESSTPDSATNNGSSASMADVSPRLAFGTEAVYQHSTCVRSLDFDVDFSQVLDVLHSSPSAPAGCTTLHNPESTVTIFGMTMLHTPSCHLLGRVMGHLRHPLPPST